NGDANNNTAIANLENVTVGVNPSPPPGTTADMILRGSNTSPIAGHYEIYDIGSNAILAASVLGQVGADFQFAGLGRFFGSDTTDMLLRSGTTGAFEVYDISNNNITNAATHELPEDLVSKGEILLDPKGELHHRYGARNACLYVVRPDGYIGF